MSLSDELVEIRRLFAHDDWANRQTLRSLEVRRGPPAKALKLLGHIIASEHLWLDRIHGRATGPVWPALPPAECAFEIRRLRRDWEAFFERLDEGELERMADYVSSKREPWSSRVRDILRHVVLHSAQHRGQIALVLREAGWEPAYTDYIHAIRSGLVR